VNTIVRWGTEGGYFADMRRAGFQGRADPPLGRTEDDFNSPVWFNVCVQSKPQCSGVLYINSVHDNMESIHGLTRTEGMLFKWGSAQAPIFLHYAGVRKLFTAEASLPVR